MSRLGIDVADFDDDEEADAACDAAWATLRRQGVVPDPSDEEIDELTNPVSP